jgi:hypothetical protein
MYNPTRLKSLMYEFDVIRKAHNYHYEDRVMGDDPKFQKFQDYFLAARENLLANYSKENLITLLSNDEDIQKAFKKLSKAKKEDLYEKLHIKVSDQIEFSDHIGSDIDKIYVTFVYGKNTQAVYMNGLYDDNFSSMNLNNFSYLENALPKRQCQSVLHNQLVEDYLSANNNVLPKWLKEIPEIKTVVDFTKWENVKEEVKEVASTNVKKLKM